MKEIFMTDNRALFASGSIKCLRAAFHAFNPLKLKTKIPPGLLQSSYRPPQEELKRLKIGFDELLAKVDEELAEAGDPASQECARLCRQDLGVIFEAVSQALEGKIPSPELLSCCDQICPKISLRLIAMAEREQKLRHFCASHECKLEEQVFELSRLESQANREAEKRGLLAGAAVSLLCLACTGLLALLGNVESIVLSGFLVFPLVFGITLLGQRMRSE